METTSQPRYLSQPRPLLLVLVLLFLFFLPLRSLELPSVFFGLSINPARFFIVMASIVFGLTIAMRPLYGGEVFRTGPPRNKWVRWLLLYSIFSLLYYYVQLISGNTILFGDDDFFFRSWQGRSIAQFLSVFTYGFLPYYLIRYYSRNENYRKMIIRSITAGVIIIILYGFIQQALHFFGLPVTGRDLYEGRVATISAGGLSFLRFSSLGSEPRHVGSFLLIALPFYLFVSVGTRALKRWFIVFLTIVAILMTFSTSTFIAAGVAILFITIDAIIQGRLRLNIRFLKYPLFFLLISAFVFYQQLLSIFGSRTQTYYQQFKNTLQDSPTVMPYGISTQLLDLSVFYYLKDLPFQNPIQILIGAGYGNFLTPIAGIADKYLQIDITQDKKFSDTNSYFVKLLVEGGVIALAIYVLMVLSALRWNSYILQAYRDAKQIDDYKRALFLRQCFIVSVVANAVNISFYYFIFMALLESQRFSGQRPVSLSIEHDRLPDTANPV